MGGEHASAGCLTPEEPINWRDLVLMKRSSGHPSFHQACVASGERPPCASPTQRPFLGGSSPSVRPHAYPQTRHMSNSNTSTGGTRTSLSVMMFLEFFIWGAWYTTIAVYMTSQQMGHLTHWPFTVNPIAAIAAPFFVGMVADRFFSTEKVFGILHLIGGLLLLAAPRTTGSPGLF